MKVRARFGLLLSVGVVALIVAGCGGGSESGSSGEPSGGGSSGEASKSPIVIGAAVDFTNYMKSFDDPALAAAKIEAEKINSEGGVEGRKIVFKVKNTQLEPARTKSAALELLEEGAEILWVTCDVDKATPAVEVGLSQKVLTVSPCIGTNEMGPNRFGEAGKLAYTFGNAAEDEGAALAELAIQKGWKTSNLITDQSLVYFKDVCGAFSKRYKELGGKIADEETFTPGDGTIESVISKVNSSKAAVETLCTTTTKELPTFLTGLRTLGNQTPVLGPWSEDGSFWLPKNPKVSNNMWITTYASIYGDDPSSEVRELISQLKAKGEAPTTGGFVAGAAAVDALKTAIEQAGGSTEGTKLAEELEKFENVKTISGNISFSSKYHAVIGREYRIIEIKEGKPHYVGLIKAKSPVEL